LSELHRLPVREPATTRLYTLSLHDALPISLRRVLVLDGSPGPWLPPGFDVVPQGTGGLDERLADAFARCDGPALLIGMDTPQVRSEEHTSELQSRENLVCRLLLEKKKKK